MRRIKVTEYISIGIANHLRRIRRYFRILALVNQIIFARNDSKIKNIKTKVDSIYHVSQNAIRFVSRKILSCKNQNQRRSGGLPDRVSFIKLSHIH